MNIPARAKNRLETNKNSLKYAFFIAHLRSFICSSASDYYLNGLKDNTLPFKCIPLLEVRAIHIYHKQCH